MGGSTAVEQAKRLAGKVTQQSVAFVFTEIDLALTFLDIASTTRSPEVRERNIANARKAQDVVMKVIERLRCSAHERNRIAAALETLNARLDSGSGDPDSPGPAAGLSQGQTDPSTVRG
jgi:hypothetical protein